MSVVSLNESAQRGVANLIAKSHDQQMDLASVLPWGQGVDRKLLPKRPEQCWIAGTPYLAHLTEEQKHELLWQETARDVSMFINLEQTLPPLYMGYVNKHADLSDDVREYLMLFSKEEIVHTLMFQRYMKLAGLPLYRSPENLRQLLTVQLPAMAPEIGVCCTLILEWVAELGAMHASQHDDIEPLTRKMFYEHHVEEARHIAFGRWVTESYLEQAAPPQAQQLRGVVRGLMSVLIPQFTYNPEVSEHLSFEFPIGGGDEARIAEVRGSAGNTALNEKRFAPLNAWLKKLEVL
ncbi:MAG TPA: diiron oxygenase [Burkholderiaceae bacterium]|nr:diiron oxygenase [Burkholderiaceae bacterium]